MQQRLYIARHAHAVDEAPSDALRPLSPKGQAQLTRLSDGLVQTGKVHAEAIWQSGLARSRETAEALNVGLGLNAPISQVDGLAPNDHPQAILKRIESLNTSCLIVGHEPNLSILSSLLLTGVEDFQRIEFCKSSILCLSRLKVAAHTTPWQIEWHVNHHFFK